MVRTESDINQTIKYQYSFDLDRSIMELVKSRFLILSDTHGMEFQPEEIPSQHVDVVIHCGNLTEESKLEEYRASI